MKMKSLFIVLTLMLAGFATSANASAWCRAESHSSWGEGTSHSIHEACEIALYQCAARTSHHDTCYVVDSGH